MTDEEIIRKLVEISEATVVALHRAHERIEELEKRFEHFLEVNELWDGS